MSEPEPRVVITRTQTLGIGNDVVTNTASVDVDVPFGEDRADLITRTLDLLLRHLTGSEGTPGPAAPRTEPGLDLSWKPGP